MKFTRTVQIPGTANGSVLALTSAWGIDRWDCLICSDLGHGQSTSVGGSKMGGEVRLRSEVDNGFDTVVLDQLSAVFRGRVVCRIAIKRSPRSRSREDSHQGGRSDRWSFLSQSCVNGLSAIGVRTLTRADHLLEHRLLTVSPTSLKLKIFSNGNSPCRSSAGGPESSVMVSEYFC